MIGWRSAGTVLFTAAIGAHVPGGYLDFLHLAPAFFGAGLFAAGVVGARWTSRPSEAVAARLAAAVHS